jgi:hypothetical protein
MFTDGRDHPALVERANLFGKIQLVEVSIADADAGLDIGRDLVEIRWPL